MHVSEPRYRKSGVGFNVMASEAWHKKHAIQITAALPDKIDDALIVLDLARELVLSFLADSQSQRPALALERERGAVVSLSSASSGNNR